jgi:hypothetical protein
VQADRIGARHGDHVVGSLKCDPAHRVPAEADVVVDELLLLFEAEAEIDHGEPEAHRHQIQQRVPGARANLGP